LFSPHVTIDPSLLRPRLWYPPPAIAVKPEFGDGTSVCPHWLAPHAATEPLLLKARL
jgi:hypothetical protein